MSAENRTSEGDNRLPAGETRRLQLVRERVREIRRALERPTAGTLDSAVPLIDSAIAELRAFCAAPPSGSRPALRAAALELQREVAKVETLFAACGAFSAGWAAVVWGLAGDYAADGSQRPRVTGRRVSLEA